MRILGTRCVARARRGGYRYARCSLAAANETVEAATRHDSEPYSDLVLHNFGENHDSAGLSDALTLMIQRGRSSRLNLVCMGEDEDHFHGDDRRRLPLLRHGHPLLMRRGMLCRDTLAISSGSSCGSRVDAHTAVGCRFDRNISLQHVVLNATARADVSDQSTELKE